MREPIDFASSTDPMEKAPSFPSRHPALYTFVAGFALLLILAVVLAAVLGIKHRRAEALAREACDTAKPRMEMAAWRPGAIRVAREKGAKVIEYTAQGEQTVVLSFPAIFVERFECVVAAREGVIRKAEVVFHD